MRFTQKQGLKGAVGGWKDFLTRHDKKFGSGLSDPAKRSKDILIAFLETFPQQFQKVTCIRYSELVGFKTSIDYLSAAGILIFVCFSILVFWQNDQTSL